MSRPFAALSLAAASVLLAACSTPAAPPGGGSAQPTATNAPAATLAPPAGSVTATAASTATAAPDPSGAPTAAPSATAASTADPAPSATAAALAPIPEVKVANIGVHVGGGPNDAPTKAPIQQSVSPHFDDLKRCWNLVEDKKKPGDFGIDLLIDKAGGKAKVSHPRTTMKGAGHKECLVAVFEAIDFKKPRKGDTMVSYSIRFTP